MKFIDELRKFAIKNRTLLIIGSLVLLFAYFQNPSGVMNFTTQSILGSTAGFFASLFGLSTLMVFIGVILILIPEPATTITGIIMVIVAGITSGFSFIATLNNIIPGINLGKWGLIALGVLVLYRFAIGKGPKIPSITIKVPKSGGVDPQRVLY